jgi:hypothetical protein
VVLNFYSFCRRIEKRYPRLRPSDQWRLTVIGLKVFSYFWLDEDVLTLATWATIASWPAWPFHLFTDVSPIDVTSTESGLVCYSFLNCYFTTPVNSVGSMFI